MVSKEITIKNASGLESKVAARLIQKVSAYESRVWIQKNDRKANAKSLLGILSLGIGSGEKVLLIADGPDEKLVINDLEQFVERGMTD